MVTIIFSNGPIAFFRSSQLMSFHDIVKEMEAHGCRIANINELSTHCEKVPGEVTPFVTLSPLCHDSELAFIVYSQTSYATIEIGQRGGCMFNTHFSFVGILNTE